ncbi:hypothetical protein ACQ7CU_10550 [Chryseobacterium arthrosphaerae]|uniref:hypothetical protein n=1 Tax=Chryseobacterium arthrosphaerae TaxID=651561 RepID=UPI003D33F7D6
MRHTVLVTALFLLTQSAIAQEQHQSHNSIPVFFDEIKTASKQNTNLWNKDLYGPMLLVDPKTREIFANEADTEGLLKLTGNVYSGILPDKINIANTAINWSGKRWAMIMLPLPQNKQNRLNLLAHESFHSIQPSLGFTLSNAENNHLDQKDGRMYLRLELEALKKAVQSSSEKERQKHLTNALMFRKYRHSLYRNANTTENLLELNEGIAEFTGAMFSGRNKAQMTQFFTNGIDEFFKNPTFVRSFAYHTIPAYGYLLSAKDKSWNRKISDTTNLTDYFVKAFRTQIPDDLKEAVSNRTADYNGKVIIEEETAREEKTKKLIAEYTLKFIDQPHFEIRFEKMNVSFDPRNMVPIEDKGTVYPNIRVTDKWGILTVENGALMSPNWDKISISNPTQITDKKISGDDWALELSNGYTVEKDQTSGNYKLKKTIQ